MYRSCWKKKFLRTYFYATPVRLKITSNLNFQSLQKRCVIKKTTKENGKKRMNLQRTLVFNEIYLYENDFDIWRV